MSPRTEICRVVRPRPPPPGPAVLLRNIVLQQTNTLIASLAFGASESTATGVLPMSRYRYAGGCDVLLLLILLLLLLLQPSAFELDMLSSLQTPFFRSQFIGLLVIWRTHFSLYSSPD